MISSVCTKKFAHLPMESELRGFMLANAKVVISPSMQRI